jgi:PIN domain nuclease of toxin-antitoxin system
MDSMQTGIVVPAICQVEVAQLVHRKRISLQLPIDEWLSLAIGYPGVRIEPLSATIAAEAYALPGAFHGDPADRLIVATARILDADLLTDDGLIRRYDGVRTPS